MLSVKRCDPAQRRDECRPRVLIPIAPAAGSTLNA